MTIEQRLQLVIGFVKQNATSTQAQLVDFLVSQGDTQKDAENAIPIYIQMLVDFGYITTATYEAMRDWGNAVSDTALSNASNTLLNEYYKQKQQAEEVAQLQSEIASIEQEITDTKAEYDRVQAKQNDVTDQEIKEAIDFYAVEKYQPIIIESENRLLELKEKLNGYN